MSQENKRRVEEILDAVRDGLGPYVLYRYKKEYTRKKYLEEIRKVLDLDFDVLDEETAIEKFDTEKWLNLMIFRWDEVFPNKPDKADYRSHFYGLRSARNKWAHPRRFGPFTDDQVRHVATTAILLLKGTNAKAKEEIETIQSIADDLSSKRSSKSEQKPTETPVSSNDTLQSSTNNPKSKPIMSKSRPDTDNGRGQAKVAEDSVRMATKAKEKQATRPPIINAEGRNQGYSLKNRKPANRKEHSLMTLKQLIRQNQKAIIIAIIIIAILVLIVIALQKPIDECDPEILGQRYSGVRHALARASCWLSDVANA